MARPNYVSALDRPRFIGSEIYRRSTYGAKHPLAIPRISATIDLLRALGWLSTDVYIESPVARPDQLTRFHAPDYVAAVMAAEVSGQVEPAARERYNIGRNGNPVFPEIFRRPATACGASLLAADMLLQASRGIIHSPAGGTHHGRPDRASGFCYFNDPVLAILRLLDGGISRVAYVDLDAHHGDGVEDAFAGDPRVLTVSVHEAGRWPGTGMESVVGVGGMARNLPVPAGFNDSEMALAVDAAILPLVQGHAPEALLIQCGCDGLADDPQSGLELSNRAIWRAVGALKGLAPRVLVLGGGGYNPWAVARCWTGIWGVLNGFDVEAPIPAAAEAVLRGLSWNHSRGRNPPDHWFTTLADPPRNGPIRPELRAIVAAAVADG
jgi:acetoin utilization protein AcuC